MTPGVVAITMAGMGSRFRQAGYDMPKYQIEVLGRPLFDWSMLSLSAFADAGWRFRFATLRADAAVPYLTARCGALGLSMEHVLELDGLTDGQATTALQLLDGAQDEASLSIFNIDTFVRPGAMNPADILADTAGWVPCFPGPGDGWSFARTDGSDRILELREKQRISPNATVGLYGFASVADYRALYASFFATAGNEEKGERYIAPMYNALIEAGEMVRMTTLTLDDVGMLGTPAQVDDFKANPPPSVRTLIR